MNASLEQPLPRWDGEPLAIETAHVRILEFTETFGPTSTLLAAHGAVLERIRPECLALIRQNFLPGAERWLPHLDADVLFGPLARELGGGYFVMDKEVRRQLIQMLDMWGSRRGEHDYRSRRVARMVRQYVEQARRTDARVGSSLFDDYLNVVNWVALGYDEPERAAAALVRMIDGKIKSGTTSKIRFTGVSELLELPMAALFKELRYARGIDALSDQDYERARKLFQSIGALPIEFGGVTLPAAHELLARVELGDVKMATGASPPKTEGPSAQASSPAAKLAADLEYSLQSSVTLSDSPLHQLVMDNDIEGATEWLRAHPKMVDIPGREHKTALHLAAEFGRVEIARLLIGAGAHVDARDARQATPLFPATCNGHLEIARLLVANRADVNARNARRRTPLIGAAYYGHYEIVALLLDHGASAAGATHGEYTAACGAAVTGRRRILELLLKNGANLAATTEEGYSLLIMAAAGGDPGIIARVLDGGQHRVTDRDKSNWTALHHAAYARHEAAVALLLELGMEVSVRDTSNWTALHLAAQQDAAGVVRALLDYGQSPDTTIGPKGYTALHIAAHHNSANVARTLLAKGADPNIGAYASWPLLTAATSGFADTLRALLSHPATDVTVEDSDHRRALLLAVHSKASDAVAALLERRDVERNHQAPIDAKKNKATPLWLAIEQDWWECAALLCSDDLTDIADRDGKTVLNCAAEKDAVSTVAALLRRSVDPNHLDKRDYSPLRAAIDGNSAGSIRLLAQAGADVNFHDRRESLLHFAVRKKRAAAVSALVAEKCDVDARDRLGRTPLHLAASEDSVEMFQLLSSLGAQASCRDVHGLTPLHRAIQAGATQVAASLLAAGSPIDETTADGWTALHFAAQRELPDIAQTLLGLGADLEALSMHPPMTPLQAAAEAGATELCRLLVAAGAQPNAANFIKGPPLMLAIQNGHFAAALELLRAGADAHAIDLKSGATALQLLRGRLELQRLSGIAADDEFAEELLRLLTETSDATPRSGATTQPVPVERRITPRAAVQEEPEARPIVPPSHLSGTSLLAGLDFEHSEWPVSGGWHVQTDAAKRKFLALVMPARKHDEAFIRDTQVAGMMLPFYERVTFWRVRHRHWPERRLAHFYLRLDEQMFRLQGTSPPVHEVNAKAPLKLNEKNILDYARFFCFFVRGEGGPFMLLEDPDDGALTEGLDATVRGVIRGCARPAHFPGVDADRNFLVDCVLAYSDAVFIANLKIQPNGMIEMLDDEPIAASMGKLVDAPLMSSDSGR